MGTKIAVRGEQILVKCDVCGEEVYYPRECDKVFYGNTKPHYECLECQRLGEYKYMGRHYVRTSKAIREHSKK